MDIGDDALDFIKKLKKEYSNSLSNKQKIEVLSRKDEILGQTIELLAKKPN